MMASFLSEIEFIYLFILNKKSKGDRLVVFHWVFYSVLARPHTVMVVMW